MKIIKHGTTVPATVMRGECQGCGCVVACAESETKHLVDRDTVPGSAVHYVTCPECGRNYLWVVEVENR